MGNPRITQRMTRRQISRIHAMRDEGRSFREIAEYLDLQGVKCTLESVRLHFRRDVEPSNTRKATEVSDALAIIQREAESLGLEVEVNRFSLTIRDRNLVRVHRCRLGPSRM